MKTKINFLKYSLILFIAAFTMSCGDQFTEEDALEAQQSVDLALYIYNGSTLGNEPIEGATVTINQGGDPMEVVSDANGVALFPGIAIGSYIYKIEADSFITKNGTNSISTSNFRISQFTQQISLTSATDESTATIKGTIFIDTDVTNEEKETVADLTLRFDVNLSDGYRTYTTQTDADGNYSVTIPTKGVSSSTYVRFFYPDLELDQTIAVNKFDSETGSFPEVLPRIETMATIFGASTDGNNNPYFYDSNVRSVYAIADSAPSGGTTATISDVYLNADGEVTGIGFSNGGDYTGDADGVVNVQIVSLDGGTGASIEINLGDQTNLSSAYSQFGTATRTITAGSGYPTDDYTLNKVDYRWPSFSNNIYIYAGDVRIVNGDYGTGVYRSEGVNN
ncbi:hypothetical protein [Reichenbachiella sp.]|uniref:hypothetical protein n=1 Tax=Reichenbachiella sp. TaxID=2184521 RepID=UPI003BB21544